MQVKYRIYTRQSAAFMHSSWTLLQVANVGTHQLIQQMSRNTPRASRKENRYDIQYSIHLTKKNCFAREQLLENDYCLYAAS